MGILWAFISFCVLIYSSMAKLNDDEKFEYHKTAAAHTHVTCTKCIKYVIHPALSFEFQISRYAYNRTHPIFSSTETQQWEEMENMTGNSLIVSYSTLALWMFDIMAENGLVRVQMENMSISVAYSSATLEAIIYVSFFIAMRNCFSSPSFFPFLHFLLNSLPLFITIIYYCGHRCLFFVRSLYLFRSRGSVKKGMLPHRTYFQGIASINFTVPAATTEPF